MNKYQCHKIVEAEPMTFDDFIKETGRESNKVEIPNDGYKVVYKDGYVSWSPKEVFENGYTVIKEEIHA
ncbi:hypothetical protein KTC96_24765 (plasmid) [Clostridium estertheticum]|uniref:hypothetical protein n=1 Tax=Clostridium estertheticum TaxID=238834 RepID=UPI001C7DE2DD|nr:hypothetical protein [Clostridium estertheticum]MBX4259741.1 hypothetical protein [Clostridium estertheticum]WLC73328.1 hypothetical protein KTC96_24765 [Clostridium estertheticum]